MGQPRHWRNNSLAHDSQKRRSIHVGYIQLTIGLPLYVWLYLVQFSTYLMLNNIVTLKSLKVIENGTIRKPEHGFLFVFYSNYGRIFSR